MVKLHTLIPEPEVCLATDRRRSLSRELYTLNCLRVTHPLAPPSGATTRMSARAAALKLCDAAAQRLELAGRGGATAVGAPALRDKLLLLRGRSAAAATCRAARWLRKRHKALAAGVAQEVVAAHRRGGLRGARQRTLAVRLHAGRGRRRGRLSLHLVRHSLSAQDVRNCIGVALLVLLGSIAAEGPRPPRRRVLQRRDGDADLEAGVTIERLARAVWVVAKAAEGRLVIQSVLRDSAGVPAGCGEQRGRAVSQQLHEGGERAGVLGAVGGNEVLDERDLRRRRHPALIISLLGRHAALQVGRAQDVVHLVLDERVKGDVQSGHALAVALDVEDVGGEEVGRAEVVLHVLQHLIGGDVIGLQDLLHGRDDGQRLGCQLLLHDNAILVHLRGAVARAAHSGGRRLEVGAHGGHYKGRALLGRVVAARHQRKTVRPRVLAKVGLEPDDELALALAVLGRASASHGVEGDACKLVHVVGAEEDLVNLPTKGLGEVASASEHLDDLRDVHHHQRGHVIKLVLLSVVMHHQTKVNKQPGQAGASLPRGDELHVLGEVVGAEDVL